MVGINENNLNIPESIGKAICAVMGNITRLSKENDNKFDRYKFTSVDDFIEAVNPLCAAAGLFILQTESKPPEFVEKEGKNGTQRVIWFEFDFYLGVGGDLFGPLKRSVFVPSTGAQAFGSGQSYSLKQFMRSLFLIPTGEKDDPDKTSNKGMESAPTLDTKSVATRINRSITNANTTQALDKVSVIYNDDLLLVKSASATAYDFLMDAIKKRSDELNIAVANANEENFNNTTGEQNENH